ncbi:MAG TPA: energy transducer TonB [Acidobacteriaceae bacterium]
MLIALACLSAGPAVAQTTQADLSARIMSKPLYLRGFWTDDKLQFDADGHPKKTYQTGSFAVSGFDAVKVSLSGNKLKIDGDRFGLEFTPEGDAQKYPLPDSGKRDAPNEQIHIEIEGVKGGDFGKALDAIFAGDLAELAPSLPPYWRHFAAIHFRGPGDLGRVSSDATADLQVPGVSESRPMHIGGSVAPPKVVDSVNPDYTPAARRLKMGGKTQLYFWIEPDGTPSHFAIMRPIGLGLDEAAIEAISKYKFTPAMQNGKPVKVDLYMYVSFSEVVNCDRC